MNNLKHNQGNLPVLTETAIPADFGAPLPYPEMLDLRLTALASECGGYDPYNSAPPVPRKTAGQA